MQWLILHPQFLKNPFYITGDSYSGIPVPIIVDLITKGNMMYITNNNKPSVMFMSNLSILMFQLIYLWLVLQAMKQESSHIWIFRCMISNINSVDVKQFWMLCFCTTVFLGNGDLLIRIIKKKRRWGNGR